MNPPLEPSPATIHRSTSAGGVVVGIDGRIVVVSQKGVSWSLPKGGVNEGEDHLVAARREIREETGIVVLTHVADLPHFERSPIGSSGHLKRLVFFLFRTVETRLAPEDPDNPEALWLAPPDAVERLSHPRDREFLADVVRVHGLA